MSGESNGRIKLSWAQIAWAIATIATVIGAWYDTRTQIALVRQEIGIRQQAADTEHVRMWRAIDDANAAARQPQQQRRQR